MFDCLMDLKRVWSCEGKVFSIHDKPFLTLLQPGCCEECVHKLLKDMENRWEISTTIPAIEMWLEILGEEERKRRRKRRKRGQEEHTCCSL